MFDQVIRLIFQFKQPAPDPDLTVDDLFDASRWTTLFGSTTRTKAQKSAKLAGLTLPPSNPRYAGSNDNNAIGGIAPYAGEEPVLVKGNYFGLTDDLIKAQRELSQHSLPQIDDLTVYMVTRNGDIIAGTDGLGIPVVNYQLSSTGSEGLNAQNTHPFSYSLKENWDETAKLWKRSTAADADFDPLAN